MPARIPYLVADDGRRYALDKNGRLSLGSGNDDVTVSGGQVLAGHMMIYTAGENVRVQAGSGEVWLNGRLVDRLTKVEENDRLQIGMLTLTLLIDDSSASVSQSNSQQRTAQNQSRGSRPAFSMGSNNAFSTIGDDLMEDPELPETPTASQPATSPSPSQPAQSTSSPTPTPPPSSPPPPAAPSDALAQFSKLNQLVPQQNQPRSLQPATPQQNQSRSLQPSKAKHNQSIYPANFTHEQRRMLLQEYFADAMIYRPKPNGGMEFNLFERWGRTRNATGKTWVLLTEGMKLAAKMGQAMADSGRQKVSDATYVDDVIRESIFDLIDKAMHELQIFDADLVREPLVIYGPIFWRASGIPIENICARQGHDGYMRFSAQEVSIILLTDDQVGVYKCNLDTLTGRPGQQIADAYFYSDITSVSIRDTDVSLPLEEEKKEITIHAFRLGVTGGETVQVSLSSPAIKDIFQSDVYEDPEHRKTVRVLQQMWRTKKRQ